MLALRIADFRLEAQPEVLQSEALLRAVFACEAVDEHCGAVEEGGGKKRVLSGVSRARPTTPMTWTVCQPSGTQFW